MNICKLYLNFKYMGEYISFMLLPSTPPQYLLHIKLHFITTQHSTPTSALYMHNFLHNISNATSKTQHLTTFACHLTTYSLSSSAKYIMQHTSSQIYISSPQFTAHSSQFTPSTVHLVSHSVTITSHFIKFLLSS